MKLQGRNVAVVGLGQSGRAAAALCLERGATVHGYDEHAGDDPGLVELKERGLSVSVGPLPSDLSVHDVVVVSPGVPRKPQFDAAEAAGREVIGEMELASRFVERPIVLIGGTNGKSTVTAWVGEMMRAGGREPFVGGNFGTPLSVYVSALVRPTPARAGAEVLVLEISSFQAERVPTLQARCHTLLNISEDHLDRYDGFRDYADAKGNPFVNMTEDDYAVIPAGDARVARQAGRGQAEVVTFGIEKGDISVDGEEIVDHRSGHRYPVSSLKLPGLHNLSNACAAVATASVMGVRQEAIARALADFTGLPHRSVVVATVDGVRFYDDSKATNVGAAVAALRGLEEPRAVLIAGGRDKHGSYAPLVEALKLKGRAMVVLGEAADRLAEAADGALPIVRADSMRDAVARAASLARHGDAVLLSPACSSFDMFQSYKARGDAFVAAVRELTGDRSPKKEHRGPDTGRSM